MATYFIDPIDGNDETGDGTREKPFRTFVRACYFIDPADGDDETGDGTIERPFRTIDWAGRRATDERRRRDAIESRV